MNKDLIEKILNELDEEKILSDLPDLILEVFNKIAIDNEWSYILKVGSKVVNIDHIIKSGIIPSNRDKIVIDNVTYRVGFATYYSEEQIVEWEGYNLNNTKS